MAKSRKPPELTFQQHIAAYLTRIHKFGKLEQTDITDTQHCIAEEQLWNFLVATQPDTIQKLKDDYGTDSRQEVFNALRKELDRTPLWILFRQGLKVRGLEFRLFYPKPRSAASASAAKYAENRIAFRPHFYFGDTGKEIDFVFFLNGLPIVALELKHEANQNVHNAVAQYVRRDHAHRIFQHPFLYLAADTTDVKAATDPSREENFRWHNMGLTNKPANEKEYPVEFLYRDVLSRDHLLEALSFFLIRVPEREAVDDKPASPAFTIFPRFHQSRLVRRVADDITTHYAATGEIGKKYLVEHSAGSGKTLSICWLAERLHSLFKPGTNEKLVDITFILTDRRSLNKNVADDIENFTHLKEVVGVAKKADHLPRFLRERKPIIVTTLQKFAWVLEQLRANPDLKTLRVAFLIDEAHRSQEGQLGSAIRVPFRTPEEPDEDAPELMPEDQLAKVIREFDPRQLFVAFTATPSGATVDLFGNSFDTYTEAEAIAEGYIVDVATSIISYKTLYNLRLPIIPDVDGSATYSQGVVAQALRNVAFQDDELIQYKSEVMLRIFDEDIKDLIGGRAKAMIVASSRVAGLKYFNVIKEKLRERGADYKVLYAFSDFVHPVTGEEIHEHAVNELNDGELIEDRFEGSDYRIMIVASKFQTGFDQPLLVG
ncbi:MAG TPA: DEAD/DEAH box helicase family protein, partial [Planctomycetaceae bacterium]|nr:DEAD/DEAH box helicase family protein [Planctomycetaceae bacterium]